MISLPKEPKVIQKDGNKAVIEVSELYPGYGATIGNALRRVLYSSLPGAAIVSAKFDHVSHEFSTIDGILEDMIEISLNLKQVRLILHGDEPQTLIFKAKGKREVRASDIETPSQVEIMNKDAHIATLTSPKSSLTGELRVERGMGYLQADQNQRDKKEIGVIRLDAIFTPVRKVNFEVENMRVGDRTDFNRLLIEITTDGTITPETAFIEATQVLVDHFQLLTTLEVKEPVVKKSRAIKRTQAKKVTTKKVSFSKKKKK